MYHLLLLKNHPETLILIVKIAMIYFAHDSMGWLISSSSLG